MSSSELQINENRTFQRWFWAAQRVAWVAIAIVLVGAVLGFAGNGRYSHRTVGDSEFSIHHPAILRRHTQDMMTITINTPKAETLLHFDAMFQDTFSVVSMVPPPTGSFATSAGVAYRFALSGNGPKTIRVGVSAEKPGQVDYSIVADGRMALLSTLILP